MHLEVGTDDLSEELEISRVLSLGSTDVVWANSWLGWIATSRCIADEVGLSWEWDRSPSRTESHEGRWKQSELLDFSSLLQTPSARRE